MIKTIEYKDEDGKKQTGAFMTSGSAYQLTGGRELFAQRMAQGVDSVKAYVEAFAEQALEENAEERKEKARRLCRNTTIVLRIQELQRPVLRKLKHKIEYNVQRALEQCEIAFDLAYNDGDSKGILKAVEMQARLSKLLVEQIDVNHKHGLLDNETTEVLIAMRDEIRIRKEKQKKLLEKKVLAIESVSQTPHQAPFVEAEMVPSGGSTIHSG